MLGGIKQDLLQIQPVGRLDLRALGDGHPCAAQPLGQLVANPLELAQVKQPGIRAGLAWAVAQAAQRVGGDESIRELALEARDLSPQRAPRSRFVLHQVRFANRKQDLRLPDVLV
jgi:hypothetical protein